MSTDAERIAELERQMAAVLARLGEAAGATPSIPLTVAAHQMGLPEATLRKRAQRAWRVQHPGVGRFNGRWYFSRAYVDRASGWRNVA